MISLAGRDMAQSWSKFVLTGMGLGLLIAVTLTMAGVYRGMVDDGKALLANTGADIWVVQKDTLGPYAESSSLNDDTYRDVQSVPGVAQAANVTYLTMQVRQGELGVRAMVVGISAGGPGKLGWPPQLVAGRHITRNHYEAVADVATGFKLGERISLRRNQFTVVGLTRRMVSSSGDPMVFVPLKDAQDAQFLKDNDAILQNQRRGAAQGSQHAVNAVLVAVKSGFSANEVAHDIAQWKRLTAVTSAEMEEILVGKLIATSAKQIGLFLVILAIVSAAIIAFIIYTLTMGKIREIAILKLIGASNTTIGAMILQQSLGLGLIGFVVGKIAASLWVPVFPKYVLLVPQDAAAGFAIVMLICVLASLSAIGAALRVDPADAIGG